MRIRVVVYIALGVMSAVVLGATVPASAQQQGGADKEALLKEAAAQPTPRMPDGRPDLTGFWTNPPAAPPANAPPSVRPTYSADGNTLTLAGRDVPKQDEGAQANFKARAADQSRRPPYKPEYVAKQRELMYTASNRDPGLRCYPYGVPRIGWPQEIATTPTTVYLLYKLDDATNSGTSHRVIPIGGQHRDYSADGKAWFRTEPLDHEALPNGDSIANWEGDTLVIDAVNFDPETWLDGDGDFHSESMRVIERFTRKGNTLEYDVTVEDPALFTGPWKPVFGRYGHSRIGSITLLLGRPDQHIREDYPCIDRDSGHKVNNDRF